MKKQYIILLVILFATHYVVWSQSQLTDKAYYTVAAPSGLTFRSEPSVDSKKLGKFPPGEYLELIEDTGKFLSVIDNGLAVNGNWFKVKRMQHSWDKKPTVTGYVFSGYLLKNESKPYNPSNAIATENSTFKFKNFNLDFYFYENDNSNEGYAIVKKDTAYVEETVFNDLSDKLIHIEPKVKIDKVELFYSFQELIRQVGVMALNPKENYQWEGSSSFKKLPITRHMALFPKIEYEKVGTSRQVNLKLRDTLVHYPGEMGGTTATMSFNGKPCTHSISHVILKVILHHSNGAMEIKYIKISLSYGC